MFISIKKLMCKFGRHQYIVLKEPIDSQQGNFEHPFIFDEKGMRYCKSCKRLEKFDYHCLGLNPPSYIVIDVKLISYKMVIKDLVEDLYHLTPEDLQLIKILKPELYDYCKLYVNRVE